MSVSGWGGGSRRQRTGAVRDVEAEGPIDLHLESASDVQVLVLDGIFLHRPELRDCRPTDLASVVVDKNDLAGAVIVRGHIVRKRG